MRELIDGVIYDTDKAELIGDTGGHWIGTMDGGALYIQTQLYKTKSGKFFTAERCPRAPSLLGWLSTGGYSSGWDITPINKDRAIAMVYRWKWDFKKAGLKQPQEA